MLKVMGKRAPTNDPVMTSTGMVWLRRKQLSSEDSSRCSSSGRCVHAVTRYDSLNRRAGGRRSVTNPESSRMDSHMTSRCSRSSRMS